nr:unnamed protein product [Digitaria exilis]
MVLVATSSLCIRGEVEDLLEAQHGRSAAAAFWLDGAS